MKENIGQIQVAGDLNCRDFSGARFRSKAHLATARFGTAGAFNFASPQLGPTLSWDASPAVYRTKSQKAITVNRVARIGKKGIHTRGVFKPW